MTKTKKLDRVMLFPKGAYDASESYERYDLVSFNKNAYICRKPCTGIEPEFDSEYWHVYALNLQLDDETLIVNDGKLAIPEASATRYGKVNVVSTYDDPSDSTKAISAKVVDDYHSKIYNDILRARMAISGLGLPDTVVDFESVNGCLKGRIYRYLGLDYNVKIAHILLTPKVNGTDYYMLPPELMPDSGQTYISNLAGNYGLKIAYNRISALISGADPEQNPEVEPRAIYDIIVY